MLLPAGVVCTPANWWGLKHDAPTRLAHKVSACDRVETVSPAIRVHSASLDQPKNIASWMLSLLFLL